MEVLKASVIILLLTLLNLKVYFLPMKRHLLFGILIIMVMKNSAIKILLLNVNLLRSIIGLIDALELFAGIIIFSDSKAEDKIRCKILLVLFCFYDNDYCF